jgi:hypothetical protein
LRKRLTASPNSATGNPDEILPPLGANRFYLDSSEWKQKLASKIRNSDILVLLVEFTEATEWEIAELLKDENRCRAILCLPEPGRSQSWRNDWTKLQSEGLPLPDVDDATAAVVFSDLEDMIVIRVRGHWGFWGDALRAAVVSGLSVKHSSAEIDFGSRLPRGETIEGGSDWGCSSVLGRIPDSAARRGRAAIQWL